MKMATNGAAERSYDVRGKLSRLNTKEKRLDRLNYHSGHVSAKEKNVPANGDTFNIPELLCQCQQKCTDRVSPPLIQKISMYFFGMRDNKEKQNRYLADLILSKEKKIEVADMQPGKRLRKMSFRYFVPILTDIDLTVQVEESRLKGLHTDIMRENETSEKTNGLDSDDEEKKRDHIEVCLKAFTSVHVISEKRVNIVRSTCKLKKEVYCTKPLTHNLPIGSPSVVNKSLTDKPTYYEDIYNLAGPSDVSLAAVAWLSKQCEQNKPTFAINPRTLLPEGLVLPDSVTCMAVCPRPQYDLNRDALIVDNFFNNQLWKPEYTGGLQSD